MCEAHIEDASDDLPPNACEGAIQKGGNDDESDYRLQ